MSISNVDVEKLILGFPEVEKRVYKFGEDEEDNNDSYLKENREAAVWLLDNSNLLFKALLKYRITTLEEEE